MRLVRWLRLLLGWASSVWSWYPPARTLAGASRLLADGWISRTRYERLVCRAVDRDGRDTEPRA